MKKCILILLVISFLFWPAAELRAEEDYTIVIPEFEVISSDADIQNIGGALANMMITELNEVSEITVVERSRLEDALEEYGLQESGLVQQEEEAKEIGGFVGADFVVAGSLVDLGMESQFRMDFRFIDVDEGVVVNAGRVRGERDELADSMLSEAAEKMERFLLGVAPSDLAKVEIELEETELYPEEEYRVKARGYDESGEEMEIEGVWEVTDELGEVIPQYGAETTLKTTEAGSGVLSFETEELRDEIELEVAEAPSTLDRLVLEPEATELEESEEIKLRLKAFDQQGEAMEVEAEWTVAEGPGQLIETSNEEAVYKAEEAGRTLLKVEAADLVAQAELSIEPKEESESGFTLSIGLDALGFRVPAKDQNFNEAVAIWAAHLAYQRGQLELEVSGGAATNDTYGMEYKSWLGNEVTTNRAKGVLRYYLREGRLLPYLAGQLNLTQHEWENGWESDLYEISRLGYGPAVGLRIQLSRFSMLMAGGFEIVDETFKENGNITWEDIYADEYVDFSLRFDLF
ncbi:CsgG/HfaB family protein [Fuchsiella alkaliacetigena]|uniref:CsgG/HfaB family protein n=1 Tax=Fuchsiella alkaliacetigena TaxID=957042 RepID=UPI00200ACEB0|nr:CsgG/HfaB family protein [Fuchsiella alkaliacetigena]MCK8825836.1 CsgG/HfaB family protein [Fuchsiella alkaliacetigena]